VCGRVSYYVKVFEKLLQFTPNPKKRDPEKRDFAIDISTWVRVQSSPSATYASQPFLGTDLLSTNCEKENR
jgi:hypothetical protein